MNCHIPQVTEKPSGQCVMHIKRCYFLLCSHGTVCMSVCICFTVLMLSCLQNGTGRDIKSCKVPAQSERGLPLVPPSHCSPVLFYPHPRPFPSHGVSVSLYPHPRPFPSHCASVPLQVRARVRVRDKNRNLGFSVDSIVAMKQHVIRVSQTANYELTHQFHPQLPYGNMPKRKKKKKKKEEKRKPVTSCVLSILSYCSSPLVSTPSSVIQPTQSYSQSTAPSTLHIPPTATSLVPNC